MTLVVVHLVRRQNGPRALQRFLQSYLAHTPGAEHELLLAMKGFGSTAELEACLTRARAEGAQARHLAVPDAGYDLTAYARVVAEVPADRYCFLNSFSCVLAEGWLGHLSAALDAPDVGLAGATGSWASPRDYRRYHLGLPSAYADVFDGRERTRRGFLALTRQRRADKRDLGRLAFKTAAAVDLVRDRHRYERFPAAHLRTNAFAASREVMLELGLHKIRTKRDAYRLESGPSSLTRHVQTRGLRVVVVGRDAASYDIDNWDRSLTLWQGAQENLLVGDNQTEDYAIADATGRQLLSRLAWGAKARPS